MCHNIIIVNLTSICITSEEGCRTGWTYHQHRHSSNHIQEEFVASVKTVKLDMAFKYYQLCLTYDVVAISLAIHIISSFFLFDLFGTHHGHRITHESLIMTYFQCGPLMTCGGLEWEVESTTVTHSSADWWDLLLPLA